MSASAEEQFAFGHLAYLVFESVLQVVIISFAGFWSAKSGLLPKKGQKIISALNVDLFTPCLIFSKLARSLSMAKILRFPSFRCSSLSALVSPSFQVKLCQDF